MDRRFQAQRARDVIGVLTQNRIDRRDGFDKKAGQSVNPSLHEKHPTVFLKRGVGSNFTASRAAADFQRPCGNNAGTDKKSILF
jgi:hypothetical protein